MFSFQNGVLQNLSFSQQNALLSSHPKLCESMNKLCCLSLSLFSSNLILQQK